MPDYLVRATAAGATVRALAAVTTGLVEEARRRHDCYPVAAAALGRTLTTGVLLGATLKARERITIRIFGNGPLGGIIVDADASGTVRGYVQNPHVDLPLRNGKLDVGRAVGKNGDIYVTRDPGLREPYTGSAPLVSGEIAEDLTNYLYVSEQVPSTVALGVLVNPDGTVIAAGGYMVQLLPGAPEEVISALEANLKAMPPVSNLVRDGASPEEILACVCAGMELAILARQEVCFHCRCSPERLRGVLCGLGQKELTEMRAEGRAELRCHFCGGVYHFDQADLEAILAEIIRAQQEPGNKKTITGW